MSVGMRCPRIEDRTISLIRRHAFFRMLINISSCLGEFDLVAKIDGFDIALREPLRFAPDTDAQQFADELRQIMRRMFFQIVNIAGAILVGSTQDRSRVPP